MTEAVRVVTFPARRLDDDLPAWGATNTGGSAVFAHDHMGLAAPRSMVGPRRCWNNDCPLRASASESGVHRG